MNDYSLLKPFPFILPRGREDKNEKIWLVPSVSKETIKASYLTKVDRKERKGNTTKGVFTELC